MKEIAQMVLLFFFEKFLNWVGGIGQKSIQGVRESYDKSKAENQQKKQELTQKDNLTKENTIDANKQNNVKLQQDQKDSLKLEVDKKVSIAKPSKPIVDPRKTNVESLGLQGQKLEKGKFKSELLQQVNKHQKHMPQKDIYLRANRTLKQVQSKVQNQSMLMRRHSI